MKAIIQKVEEIFLNQNMEGEIREIVIMEINIIMIKEMINIIMVVINIKMEGKNIINKYYLFPYKIILFSIIICL